MDTTPNTQSAPDVKGLALAEHHFGPLLSPVTATEAQWTTYTELRRATNMQHENVFIRRTRMITKAVAAIEKDMGLDDGALRQCISLIGRNISLDDDGPRDADVSVRLFSPAAPTFIDVHILYHYRARLYEIEWFYSLGYKIVHRLANQTPTIRNPPANGPPPLWHTRNGWQSICWGYYEDDVSYDHQWRRLEVGDMGLHEEGVLDICEALFGPLEAPADDDEEATVAYRKKLVASVRLLFAAVGIQYRVASTDEEEDASSREYVLEGLSDKWVARGIRNACGFQLSSDPDAERRGREELEEAAKIERYEEEGFSDDSDDY